MDLLCIKNDDCPLCAAGIPRKVAVPVYTNGSNEVKYMMMSEEMYEVYKERMFIMKKKAT